jgi:hypothetical protein
LHPPGAETFAKRARNAFRVEIGQVALQAMREIQIMFDTPPQFAPQYAIELRTKIFY